MPPPGPPQPPYAAQPPPPAHQPMGWLRVFIQGNVMTSNMITPALVVNGARVPSRYGENVLPVYAGPTRVELHAQWLRAYGQAAIDTVVPEGQTVTLFYAAPMHQFARGRIGYEKQKRPGVAGFVALMALIVLVVVVLVGLPLFG
jgi:hypothetical protein